ncbi:uncharacterized protein LOC111605497 [Drosophila hydei]|uniref:Uncharacterized protein LOC111605497 n=1 Tax=Drosophila hydei TaxID=7224 RepID=A0A6J1MEA0_DROHY|nr:uncharacterized protein LOC111605497 [Drosophila hydei]
MSKKKSRIGIKTESMQLAQTILSTKASIATKRSISIDRLGGVEDIAQFDSSGIPFILVDGNSVRSRHQLHVTLSKREKKHMKHIKRQCSVLPWLEHTRPLSDVEPITQAEKDAKIEQDFQEDLQLLKLDIQKIDETSWESQLTESLTPIAHAVSTEDLTPNLSRIEEIRIQLEKLREQQQSDASDPMPLSEQLRIRRQATFDIDRDVSIAKSTSSLSLDFQTPILSQQRLIRATTISQLARVESRPSLQKVYSSTCLTDKSTSSMVLGSNCSRPEPFHTPKSPGAPITNRIGDLLMQLPNQQQEKRPLNPRSYSYVVTVSPKLGSNRCKVEPLSLTKTRSLMLPNAACCVPEKFIRERTIDIVAVPSTLQTKSRTFLTVPRLFKKLKK